MISRVSIPERVWGGLERSFPTSPTAINPFQSLRGFGVGWSVPGAGIVPGVNGFQSLRGFGVGWSLSDRGITAEMAGFNP